MVNIRGVSFETPVAAVAGSAMLGAPGLLALQQTDAFGVRSAGSAGDPDGYSFPHSLRLPLDRALSRPGPYEWPDAILPFQAVGIRILVGRSSVLLADEMGLGKTIQTIAAIRVLARRGEVERALLVVPVAVIPQWQRALDLWAPDLHLVTVRGDAVDRESLWAAPAHVHLCGYDSIRSDMQPSRTDWDLVVLDEAQKVKNAGAQVSTAAKELPRVRSWALTGTPLENRADDLRSILEFVDPAITARTDADLRDRLSAFQIRRRKADVLTELPPILKREIVLAMSHRQRLAYERARETGLVQLRALGAELRVQNILELLLRLKQLCNFDPASGDSVKVDDLVDRIGLLAEMGEKALVFSQFTDDTFGVRAIAARLQPFAPVVYTGAMSGAERDEAVGEFMAAEPGRVMILSLMAGGQGLNLQAASYVFHFDKWWNPATQIQAESRAHRMGQRRTVSVFNYRVADTVEDRIEEILAEKRELFDALVEGAGVGADDSFTRDDLIRILDAPGL